MLASWTVFYMRPIVYGLIMFFGSGLLLLPFSLFAELEGYAGEFGTYSVMFAVLMLMFLFSFPTAIAAEVIQFFRRRKR